MAMRGATVGLVFYLACLLVIKSHGAAFVAEILQHRPLQSDMSPYKNKMNTMPSL